MQFPRAGRKSLGSEQAVLKGAATALDTAKLAGRNRSMLFDLVANSQLSYL